MLRALTAAIASVALVGTTVVVATPAAANGPIPEPMFGMHVPRISEGVDPGISYGSIRLWDSGIAWGQVQQKKKTFWWNGMNDAVARSNEQGAEILYVLGSTPKWAATNKKQGSYPNKGAASMPDRKAWKKWVRTVAQRYGDSIGAYQIWNEANLSDFWQGSPKEMATLTKDAYDIIKAEDPTATVVAASTTVRLEKAYKKFFPKYLKQLKKKGWPVDALAVHTYPDGKGTPADRVKMIKKVKKDMKNGKVPARIKLWDTEVNYGIPGPGKIKGRQISGGTAADWVAQTYLDNLMLGVDRAYWYYWAPANNRIGITMQDGSTGAIGYQTVNSWLAGSFYGCSKDGALNICNLRDNVNPEVVVWSTDSAGTYTVPAGVAWQCNSLNQCNPIAPGTVLTIGSGPQWFGTQVAYTANQLQFAQQ